METGVDCEAENISKRRTSGAGVRGGVAVRVLTGSDRQEDL